MTPYEDLSEEMMPQVERLRIFGCHDYVHIRKEERTKFDVNSKRCILVGFFFQEHVVCYLRQVCIGLNSPPGVGI